MKNKGFSLIEILLVLGVVASFMIGAFVVFGKTNNTSKLVKIKQDVVQAKEVFDTYVDHRNFTEWNFNPSSPNFDPSLVEELNGNKMFVVEMQEKQFKLDGATIPEGMQFVAFRNGYGRQTSINYSQMFIEGVPKENCPEMMAYWFRLNGLSLEEQKSSQELCYSSYYVQGIDQVRIELDFKNPKEAKARHSL